MKSGQMIHRVTLQSRDTTKDAMGGLPNTWTDLGNRRCRIEDVSGNEYWESSGQNADAKIRVHMRNDSLTKTLTAAHRLLDERQSPAVVYDIQSVLKQNRDRDLVIICTRP